MTRLTWAVALIGAAVATTAQASQPVEWEACRAKPTAQCLSNLAITLGKTLPGEDGQRYRQAEKQGLASLREAQSAAVDQTAVQQIEHLARNGEWLAARARLNGLPTTVERIQAMAALGRVNTERGHADAGGRWLGRAEALLPKLGKSAERDLASQAIAGLLATLGRDAEALARAKTIEASGLRSATLLEMARRQWSQRHGDDARASLQAAEQAGPEDWLALASGWRMIGDTAGESRAIEADAKHRQGKAEESSMAALDGLMRSLARSGDVDTARRHLAQIDNPQRRLHALLVLADALPPQRAVETVGALLAEAGTQAAKLSGAERQEAERQLVHAFAIQGLTGEASRHLREITDAALHAEGMIDLASITYGKNKEAGKSLFEQAQGELRTLPVSPRKDAALRSLLRSERRAGITAASIPDDVADPVAKLLAYAELSDWPHVDALGKSAPPSDFDLAAIAVNHALDGRMGDMLEAAKRISSDAVRAEALTRGAVLAQKFGG